MQIPAGMEEDFAAFEREGEAAIRAFIESNVGYNNERRRIYLHLKAEDRADAADARENRMTEAAEASAKAADGARRAAWAAVAATAVLALVETIKLFIGH